MKKYLFISFPVNILCLFLIILNIEGEILFKILLSLSYLIFLFSIYKKQKDKIVILGLLHTLIFFSSFNFINKANYLYIIFYLISLILNYIYVYINILSNKVSYDFKTLKLPKEKYLFIKFFNGFNHKSIDYGILTKQNDKFIIKLENSDSKKVTTFNIKRSDIKNIDILKKPYILVNNTEATPILSFEINITLKDKSIIKLISFKNPNSFLNK